jgi:excisionase family DNA binding protein
VVIHSGCAARPPQAGGAHNGVMPEIPTSDVRLLAPAQVAEVLGVSVDEVMDLVEQRRLRGMRVGSPARWRIEEASVAEYLDEQAEEARRIALWRQSNEASFPELWGTGSVRNPD